METLNDEEECLLRKKNHCWLLQHIWCLKLEYCKTHFDFNLKTLFFSWVNFTMCGILIWNIAKLDQFRKPHFLGQPKLNSWVICTPGHNLQKAKGETHFRERYSLLRTQNPFIKILRNHHLPRAHHQYWPHCRLHG